MTLLNASAESETRSLTKIGAIVVLSIVTAIALYLAVNPFGRGARDTISVAINTPYVGQGVDVGTPVIMHGVKVGQVVSVSSISGGGVHLTTDLQRAPTLGLTDAMGIDYRPSNYFGVTGINVLPASSGRPLQSGMQINITPKGNFSLQALIYRLGGLSNGVFNQRLIGVIDRATRYVDGLNPLLETALIVGTSVAKVQTVSTERLLRNTTGVSVAFPGFVDSAISFGNDFLHTLYVDSNPDQYKAIYRYYPVIGERHQKYYDDTSRFEKEVKSTDEYIYKKFIPIFSAAQTDLFSRVGYLESSHINDLFPLLDSIRGVTDAVPKILSPDSFAYTITELRKRFERMYAGSGDQRALQVRIVLEHLPGVAAPLGQALGGSR